MPAFTNIHTLSISQEKISSVAISPSGEWLAFGARKLGQLLVWEWQSESYILKQQDHYFDMNSPMPRLPDYCYGQWQSESLVNPLRFLLHTHRSNLFSGFRKTSLPPFWMAPCVPTTSQLPHVYLTLSGAILMPGCRSVG